MAFPKNHAGHSYHLSEKPSGEQKSHWINELVVEKRIFTEVTGSQKQNL
jgi:hypothetical protein